MTFLLEAAGTYFIVGLIIATSIWIINRMGVLQPDEGEPENWFFAWVVCWPVLPIAVFGSLLRL